MALQVWLPLNGNLDNQGLSNITVTNNGATVSDNGKIGKCYEFDKDYLITNNIEIGDDFSICYWVKYKSLEYPRTHVGIRHSAGAYTGTNKGWDIGHGLPSGGYVKFDINDGNGHRQNIGLREMEPLQIDTWKHYTIICSFSKKIVQLYVNGLLEYTASISSNIESFKTNYPLTIGALYGWSLYGFLNDVRIYDHCLSPKEVSEIAKGLVLHYKMDEGVHGLANTNLIANGWGGIDNWNYTDTTIFDDVPEETPTATNSYGAITSKEYIPLIPDHSYTMSGYVKKATSKSSQLYLTLIPYDVDKKQIMPRHFSFRTESRTTLKQPLKKGDTIVYLSDVSGWSTSLTYGVHIAIFGYQDSTGYTYPDMIYTRNVLTWGTTSDKSNLDFTNNTVTLRSAYNGETIPAGTTACQSSDGATYYYVNTINSSAYSADEWIYLSGTFTPNQVRYLLAVKYVRVYASLYTGQRAAALTLIDNSASNIISDCSGYNHNGTIDGNLEINANTPRFKNCIKNTTSYPVRCNNLNIPESKGLTIACWVNPDVRGYQTSALWATSNQNTNPYDYSTTACSHTDTFFRIRGIDNTLYSLSCTSTDYPLNTWTHIAFTHEGTSAKLYINGTFARSIECPTSLVGFNSFFLGASNSGPRTTQGSWSDLRIYVTALSAQDIQELYNTSAYVDNKQNMECFEIREDVITEAQITKRGQIECNTLIEETEASIDGDGNIECNQIIEI